MKHAKTVFPEMKPTGILSCGLQAIEDKCIEVGKAEERAKAAFATAAAAAAFATAAANAAAAADANDMHD